MFSLIGRLNARFEGRVPRVNGGVITLLMKVCIHSDHLLDS